METYKITKTIRFKLNARKEKIQNILQDIKDIKDIVNDFDINDFTSNLDTYIENINVYFFYQKHNGDFAFKEKITIKNEWLKQYAKQEFIEFNANKQVNTDTKRKVKNTIGDFKELSTKIEKAIDEVDSIYANLVSKASEALNEKTRKAQTGLLLKRLSAKNALPLLISLIENTSDKNEKDDLSLRIKKQSQKINAQLLAGIQVYLPEQSNGLAIAKASFNYYTINKNPIDFRKKINEQNDKLIVELDKIIDRNLTNRKLLINDIKNQLRDKQLILGDAPMLDIDKHLSLRQVLKSIKATQKKLFSEFMQSENASFKDLKNHTDLYLFNDILEPEFNEYKEKTEKIERKGTIINQCTNDEQKKKIRNELKNLKQQRGSLINAADNNTSDFFKTYKSFAKLYRSVSQKHGKILSRLKGIEKEQFESQLLKYWALIIEENNQHTLILIPRENASKCKKWLENLNNTSKNETELQNSKLFWFESFTLRSLRKLCFGFVENGTNEFYNELSRSIDMNKYKDNEKFIQGEFEFKGDIQKIISFYKDVLQSQYAKKVLNLPIRQIEEEIINTDFADLDDFQIALEKICYIRNVSYSQEMDNNLKEFNAQSFEITSYDLKNNNKSNIKGHTKLWKNFWKSENEKQNFDIRLNPEITITYRLPKQSRIDKYGEGTALYDVKKNNRYLHPQFTLLSTISEHSNAQTKILSFLTDKEYEDSILSFNTKLKKEAIKFSFGIDNGIAELSTLGIYLPAFQKESNEKKIEELKKVSEYGFKVLSIVNLLYSENDTNGKERKIIQNPSYFLNKELYTRTFGKSVSEYDTMFNNQFEERYLLTLDLTTAKVINGQIVTNGDILSHFNLNMRNAQRLVYSMNDHSKKETAKKVILKTTKTLSEFEKQKFVEFLLGDNFDELTTDVVKDYILWTFSDNYQFKSDSLYQQFSDLRKHHYTVADFTKNTVFAISYAKQEMHSINDIYDIRNIFQLRNCFDAIQSEDEILSEINKFNVRSISNEELDLKINHLKQSIASNAVGVIDFLYKQYKERLNGEGLIVKEGFDSKKVVDDLEKFSGNIYRILERRLYQKFQNYGLVPPIQNLLTIRAEGIKDDDMKNIIRLGNIGFVSKGGTSKSCPICNGKIEHNTKPCNQCGFDCNGIMHSNDGIAGYNIAKRGFENLY